MRISWMTILMTAASAALGAMRVEASPLERGEMGSLCGPTHASAVGHTDLIWSSVIGYSNRHATSVAVVACAMTWSGVGSFSSSDINVAYGDKNDDAGASAAVSCTAAHLEDDGTVWLGATRYSCGTGGGCASNSSPTYKTTSHGTLTVEGLDFDDTAAASVLICSLPDADPEFSGVVSYFYNI